MSSSVIQDVLKNLKFVMDDSIVPMKQMRRIAVRKVSQKKTLLKTLNQKEVI